MDAKDDLNTLYQLRFCRQLTVLKDISIFSLFRSRSSRYIRIAFTVNNTILQISGGRTENKVSSTINITIFKIKTGKFSTGINSVLITQDTTIDKFQTVTFRM